MSSDIATSRTKFEELWPRVITGLQRISPDIDTEMAEHTTVAFHYIRAACTEYPEVANALADDRPHDALKNRDAIIDFLGGDIPADLTEDQKLEAAVLFGFVTRALGYGSSKVKK